MFLYYAFYSSFAFVLQRVSCALSFLFEDVMTHTYDTVARFIEHDVFIITLLLSMVTFVTLILNGIIETAQETENDKTCYFNTGSTLLRWTEPYLSRLTIYSSYPNLFIVLKAFGTLSPVILNNHIDWTINNNIPVDFTQGINLRINYYFQSVSHRNI